MACGCKKSVKQVTDLAARKQAAREEVRRLRYGNGTTTSGGAAELEADLSKKELEPASK